MKIVKTYKFKLYRQKKNFSFAKIEGALVHLVR